MSDQEQQTKPDGGASVSTDGLGVAVPSKPIFGKDDQ